VVVHNGGYPADMDRVLAVARERGLRIVEDCAHAHGSQWRGEGVGHLGDFGTFSFQMGKTLTAGEGGCVVTDDPKLAELAYTYHHIGRIPGRPFYEFHRLASNLRMTEWQGAILRAQLQRLPEQTRIREQNATYLAAGMREVAGLEPIRRDERVTRWGFYYWNFHYREEALGGVPRDVFIKAAQAEGIPVGPGAHGGCIYKNPVFQTGDGGMPAYTNVVCPVAEQVSSRQVLAIGHRTFLGTTADMDLLLEAFRKLAANVDELRETVPA
jgi:dTDP-4-amino-4,6-dideoxygalactose transaminase